MGELRTGEDPGARLRAQHVETVVDEYETALLRYTTRIVNSPTAAQDVVQNVFIKLFRHGDERLLTGGKLKSWLYRVAHNEAVDFVRHESRLHQLHDAHAEQETLIPLVDADRAAEKSERIEMVLAEVRRLHPREQQIVLLRLQEGLSYREIAEITGRSEGNVGNILHHAVKRLSQRLAHVSIP